MDEGEDEAATGVSTTAGDTVSKSARAGSSGVGATIPVSNDAGVDNEGGGLDAAGAAPISVVKVEAGGTLCAAGGVVIDGVLTGAGLATVDDSTDEDSTDEDSTGAGVESVGIEDGSYISADFLP